MMSIPVWGEIWAWVLQSGSQMCLPLHLATSLLNFIKLETPLKNFCRWEFWWSPWWKSDQPVNPWSCSGQLHLSPGAAGNHPEISYHSPGPGFDGGSQDCWDTGRHCEPCGTWPTFEPCHSGSCPPQSSCRHRPAPRSTGFYLGGQLEPCGEEIAKFFYTKLTIYK